MPQRLLKSPDRPETPADYLYARLRSRRRSLDLSGTQPFWSGEAPELGCRREIRWVFDRLEPALARTLQPYFLVLAGQDLVVVLRQLRAGEPAVLDHLEPHALFAPELLAVLHTQGDFDRLLLALERTLAETLPLLQDLTRTYRRQGPGGLEEQLETGLLRQALTISRAGPVRSLLRDLIDRRNLLAVFKHWRWQVRRPPQLVEGGQIGLQTLAKLWASRDETALARLARKQAGLARPAPDTPRHLEQLLLAGIGRRLRQAGRDLLGPGLVLDYLWRCRLALRNHSLATRLADSYDDLLEELVRA